MNIAAMKPALRRIPVYDPSHMTANEILQPSVIDLRLRPAEVMRRWPADRPIVMLHSARGHPRWARWSIIAEPAGTLRLREDVAKWITHSDDVADLSSEVVAGAIGVPPVEALNVATGMAPGAASGTELNPPHAPPFSGGWVGWLGYDLGGLIEPAAAGQSRPRCDRNWPLADLMLCPRALCFDHAEERWWAVGDAPGVEHMMTRLSANNPKESTAVVGELQHTTDPDRYMADVQRVLDCIAAGDIFQANLTHRLTCSFSGSTRDLARRAFAEVQPWYGAYMELPGDRCILSLSPELFLSVDGRSRAVTTRPIKGTRPACVGADELRKSAKDAAELNMIIDLMRNDLGRVCDFGTVRVPHGRIIESHPTVHHGVGEVTGRLRDGVTIADLMRATFPAGSITGAPKIRAMQIIDELEQVSRGPYCGAIGMISNCGGVQLNVAIRTMALTGRRQPGRYDRLDGEVDYGVGGGIVADSNPVDEYRETMAKAEALRLVLAAAAGNVALAGV